MKSIARWGTTIGLLGAVATIGFGQLKAWALPAQQIIQKLNPVPVFTITDEQGLALPLTASNDKNEVQQITGIFISQQDAKDLIAKLETQNPGIAQKFQVIPVPLGKVYELDQENENKGNIQYVPTQEAINSAKTIMEQKGQKYQGGVPLFIAVDKDKKTHLPLQLTVERESKKISKTIIPLFFDKQQLDIVIKDLQKNNPTLANKVSVDVVLLESVINTLHTSDSEILNEYVLMPSNESLQVVQQMIQEQKQK